MAKKRKRTKAKAKAPAIVASQAALAKALNRHTRTISDYVAKGMPGKRGNYNVEVCRKWISDNIKATQAIADAGDDSIRAETRKAELAIKQEQLEAKRRENQRQRGELYVAEDVELAGVELTNRIRSKCRVRCSAWPTESRAE